jgi:hypothetical protein
LPAISLASSFQHCQPRSVSITLAPSNPRRTSGELFRRNRALPVQMNTTLEFPSSSSMPWCGGLRESDVDSVIFPNSGDSSATPASFSVAVVHLWPKVSTPSRSSRRFLSALPFNLQFRGRSHLILFAFSLSACTVRITCHRPAPSAGIRPPPWSPPPVSTPARSPRPPLSVQSLGRPQMPGAPVPSRAPLFVPEPKVEEDKVVFQLGPYTFL